MELYRGKGEIESNVSLCNVLVNITELTNSERAKGGDLASLIWCQNIHPHRYRLTCEKQ